MVVHNAHSWSGAVGERSLSANADTSRSAHARHSSTASKQLSRISPLAQRIRNGQGVSLEFCEDLLGIPVGLASHLPDNLDT